MVHPAHQPASDVSSAGDCGEVVKRLQQPLFSQCLQHAQIECRAADSAAGKSKPDQALLCGRPSRIFAKPQVAGRLYLLKFLLEDFLDGWRRLFISGLLAVLAGTAATVCTASKTCDICETCNSLIP